ncbi:MAG TPA: hypothetical protein VNB90_04215 [Cytophagaceae bacterium]|jgi:hypothetical protein|nr:hypothetical protein [Cytophagaceae bacterium]
MKIRKYQKKIAAFLLLNFFSHLFIPLMLQARSITADEYDSFMPAGYTDMVDTRTGDFHYDVPLFDVPGPEGSYPIHLFYEGGIKNDKNATWTGLGWNLNVGAITREVNDIPDDFCGQSYDITESMNPSVSTNASYPAAVSMGYSIANMDAGRALYIPFQASSTSIRQNGVLHADSASAYSSYASTTFDCHAMYSEDQQIGSTIPNSPEVLNGGSMPSYDTYNVSAEGLSGQIEPAILENGTLFRSSIPSTLSAPFTATRSYPILRNFSQHKQYFRFKGEFSNSFTTSSVNAFTFSSGPSLSFGVNGVAYGYTVPDPNGFDFSTMRLAGGKHVDYFTNGEIVAGTAKAAGFLEYPSYILENGGYASSTSERKQINFGGGANSIGGSVGGFSVTNEEGMTYHYALPVYSHDNTNTKKLSTSSGVYAVRTANCSGPYAYSWLLTTVTGPDYVDKNNNGYADEGDLGQWTNFSYGKVTPNYYYRYPYTTTSSPAYYEYISGGVQENGAGYMELYFLDAVYTRSHTAIFSKASRNDALDANGASTALKLNSAILFHNDGIKTISQGMGWSYSNVYTALKNIKAANASYNNSVITVEDINTISGTTAAHYAIQILKESKLTYDYSLCKNALNSSSGNGKLTLLSVRNYGKNNTPLSPSTEFGYELSNAKSASVQITSYPANTAVSKIGTISVSTTPNPFVVGDIISFTISGVKYYAALLKVTTSSSNFSVMFLGSNMPGSGQLSTAATAIQTKNPDYSYYIDNTQHYISSFSDQWGYFKCDVSLNEFFDKDHKTSYVSGKAADCWSLRKITTGLGSTIEVNYESDSYYGSQLMQGEVFSLNQKFRYTDINTGSLRPASSPVIQFTKLDTAGLFEYSFPEDIDGKFQYGDTVKITTLGTHASTTEGSDDFKITYIDVPNRLIRGVYLGTLSSRNDPIATIYNDFLNNNPSDTTFIFNNNSSFLFKSTPTVSYGGGLRVKSITIKEGGIETYSTNYSYTSRYNGLSSGTVPFIPIIEDMINVPPVDGLPYHTDPTIPGNFYLDGDTYGTTWSLILGKYQNASNNIGMKSLANTDFVSPWVLYEFVTVSHVGNNSTSLKSEEYNYQPYTWEMINRSDQNVLSGTDGSGRQWTTHKLTISDYTSAVGQLLNYSEYDNYGSIISQTTYSYTSSPPSNQGRLDEVFHEEREYVYPFVAYKGLAIVTVKSTYPSVLSRVTSSDYLKNISSVKNFYQYDFYSGNPTEIVSKSSEGDYFKQKTVPAYTKSQYSGMALKFSSSTNRNMLSPLTATYTYKVDSTNYANAIDTLSCSVNTWSNSWSKRVLGATGFFTDSTISTDNSATVQDDRIWRPQSSYAWKSPIMNANGSYKNFVDFNWSGSPNANWQKVSTITKYDQFSNAIEKQDINGNYTAVKYGYDLTYPLEGANNTNYSEFAYSGAEDLNSKTIYGASNYFGGEVLGLSLGGGQDTTVAHTGKSSLSLTQYGSGFIYKVPIDTGGVMMGRPYRITAWVYNNGNTSVQMYYNLLTSAGSTVSTPNQGSITPATVTSPVVAGQWQQLTLDFTLTGSYTNYILNIGFTNPSNIIAYIDDFRFYPLSETVTTNVYDKASGQVTHTLDENNFYSKRTYDNSYRPVGQYKETIYGEIKQKEYQYNFGKRQ